MVIRKGEVTLFTLDYEDSGVDLNCRDGVLPFEWAGGRESELLA